MRKIRSTPIAKDLSKNYFKTFINLQKKIIIDDTIHKQKTGLARGNNRSQMLAIIYMQNIEEQIIKQSQNKISIWLRYVNDIFCNKIKVRIIIKPGNYNK